MIPVLKVCFLSLLVSFSVFAIDPHDIVQLNFTKAEVLINQGQQNRAEKLLLGNLEQNPRHLNSINLLTLLYEKRDGQQAALEWHQKRILSLIGNDSNNEELDNVLNDPPEVILPSVYHYGRLVVDLKNSGNEVTVEELEEARRYLEICSKKNFLALSTSYYLGVLEFSDREYERAISYFKYYLENNKNHQSKIHQGVKLLLAKSLWLVGLSELSLNQFQELLEVTSADDPFGQSMISEIERVQQKGWFNFIEYNFKHSSNLAGINEGASGRSGKSIEGQRSSVGLLTSYTKPYNSRLTQRFSLFANNEFAHEKRYEDLVTRSLNANTVLDYQRRRDNYSLDYGYLFVQKQELAQNNEYKHRTYGRAHNLNLRYQRVLESGRLTISIPLSTREFPRAASLNSNQYLLGLSYTPIPVNFLFAPGISLFWGKENGDSAQNDNTIQKAFLSNFMTFSSSFYAQVVLGYENEKAGDINLEKKSYSGALFMSYLFNIFESQKTSLFLTVGHTKNQFSGLVNNTIKRTDATIGVKFFF